LARCERCLRRLGAEDTSSHGRSKPKPIDVRRSGDYSFGKWKYRYQVSGLGSSKSTIRGRLAFGGKEVPPAEINDYYRTPWGFMYWVGYPKTPGGKRGWVPTPAAGSRRGQLLTTPDTEAKVLSLTADHKGRTIATVVDKPIVISLAGNPTTGYRWRTDKITGNAVELLARRPTYTAESGRSGQVGSGGTFTFKLKAVKAGKSTITLAYARSASAYGRAARTFTVTFDVKAN